MTQELIERLRRIDPEYLREAIIEQLKEGLTQDQLQLIDDSVVYAEHVH